MITSILGSLAFLGLVLWGYPRMSALIARRPPNLVILCADTLRPDHLSAYGYDRPTSPNLDRFARRGVRFEAAYATSSWTGPSVLSLLTAEPPGVHGFQGTSDVFSGGIETLAEALSARGYRTGAVSGNFVHVTPDRGFDRGFDYYNVLKIEPPAGSPLLRNDFTRFNQVRATRVFGEGLAWMRRKDARPFFLYLHTMDTHAGYKPTPSSLQAFDRGGPRRLSGTAVEVNALLHGTIKATAGDLEHLVDIYDAAVASWDEALGEFLGAMAREGLLENTVFVIVADHGEEFLDHGRFSHGVTLYEEMIRVPLILVFPDGRFGGRVVADRVSLLDVAPTLLQTAGVSTGAWHSGRSLLGLLEGGRPRTIISAELGPNPKGLDSDAVPRRHRAAVLMGDWKLLQGPSGLEAYRIVEDPREQSPLPAAEARALGPLVAEAERIASERASGVIATRPLGPDFEARLRSLGYGR